jgi:hypothetical protein
MARPISILKFEFLWVLGDVLAFRALWGSRNQLIDKNLSIKIPNWSTIAGVQFVELRTDELLLPLTK